MASYLAHFPPLRVCEECGKSVGELHTEGCSLEVCPVDGRPLTACWDDELGDPDAVALERFADVLYWITIAEIARNVPEDELLGFVHWVVVCRQEWTSKPAIQLPDRSCIQVPRAKTEYCHVCNRSGALSACSGCGRRFHRPVCDGFASANRVLCAHCYLQPLEHYRVAMRVLANALAVVAIVAEIAGNN